MISIDKYGDKKHRCPKVLWQYMSDEDLINEIRHYERMQRRGIKRTQNRELWMHKQSRSYEVDSNFRLAVPIKIRLVRSNELQGWAQNWVRLTRGVEHATLQIAEIAALLDQRNGITVPLVNPVSAFNGASLQ